MIRDTRFDAILLAGGIAWIVLVLGVRLAFPQISGGAPGQNPAQAPPPRQGRGQAPPPLNPLAAKAVEANTAFASDLYQMLNKTMAEKNLFFSPYSVSTILGLTAAGASGETAAQMAKVLHIADPEEFHAGIADINHQLGGTQNGRRPYQLSVANALWEDQKYPLRSGFAALAEKYYDTSGVFHVNFSASEAVRSQINQWVEDKTANKIKDLLPNGSIDSSTALVLTNAIFFKGAWATSFNEGSTIDGPFHVNSQTDVQARLMDMAGSFPYFENDDVQAVSLPYSAAPGSARQVVSMLLVLPKKMNGLPDVEKSITPQNLAAWFNSVNGQSVRVVLPKFTMTCASDLTQTLPAMGMANAFSAEKADFSAMVDARGVYISHVFHKAFVSVDENGTEAAAATAAAIAMTAAPLLEPVVFRADHPFFFLIRYEPTNSILFMGHVVNPSAKDG